MNNPKAQVATEFLVVLAVFMLIFVGLFLFASEHFQYFFQKRTQLSAQKIADDFAMHLQALLLAGSGTTLTLTYPQHLEDGSPYQLRIVDRNLQILWGASQRVRYYDVHLAISAFSGNLTGDLTNITSPISLSNYHQEIRIG